MTGVLSCLAHPNRGDDVDAETQERLAMVDTVRDEQRNERASALFRRIFAEYRMCDVAVASRADHFPGSTA